MRRASGKVENSPEVEARLSALIKKACSVYKFNKTTGNLEQDESGSFVKLHMFETLQTIREQLEFLRRITLENGFAKDSASQALKLLFDTKKEYGLSDEDEKYLSGVVQELEQVFGTNHKDRELMVEALIVEGDPEQTIKNTEQFIRLNQRDQLLVLHELAQTSGSEARRNPAREALQGIKNCNPCLDIDQLVADRKNAGYAVLKKQPEGTLETINWLHTELQKPSEERDEKVRDYIAKHPDLNTPKLIKTALIEITWVNPELYNWMYCREATVKEMLDAVEGMGVRIAGEKELSKDKSSRSGHKHSYRVDIPLERQFPSRSPLVPSEGGASLEADAGERPEHERRVGSAATRSDGSSTTSSSRQDESHRRHRHRNPGGARGPVEDLTLDRKSHRRRSRGGSPRAGSESSAAAAQTQPMVRARTGRRVSFILPSTEPSSLEVAAQSGITSWRHC